MEELVEAAPEIPGWKFTALKPAIPIENFGIGMEGYHFNKDNLFFYSNNHKNYPDEIDITVVFRNYVEKDKSIIENGVFIFLDNYLGELNNITTLDSVHITGKKDAEKELVPITKLKDFLLWRQKEFIEKYEGVFCESEKANYALLQAETGDGKPFMATINTDVLSWDKKASHPWVVKVHIDYEGHPDNGLPNQETNQLLYDLEEEMVQHLKPGSGVIYIGRQTGAGIRSIFFSCKDFREPSRFLDQMMRRQTGKFNMSFDIYKDKYWQSFRHFQNH